MEQNFSIKCTVSASSARYGTGYNDAAVGEEACSVIYKHIIPSRQCAN